MAMKKAASKKTEPKPPTPRQSAMTSTKSSAKKSPSAPAKAMGKKAAAMGSKETSAKTRDKAKKFGSSYLKSGPNSMAGDLGGPNWKQLKGFEYGSPMFQRSRTEQRSIDQAKRKKK